ncbi:metalloregulator ArsR/SmtB family transcription factor [Patescibacteria group bacterium]|nr:metalloregulator ArsR/SmtB family transcription factor [Patescibacteria group bacterium]MBU3999699.1 metalloregulator ArsR/SmtB family transcription factor [Patescibacteria group bacterium]MBU4056752.1 metalloregulator ArsR/SmtB family transcription factor [Patescibacteria group bacterium]MBU4368254.1 metalloregulator ArsR/SmtB family transcription factor [Patescibacteria group bacterium]
MANDLRNLEKILKALANKRRLAILEYLKSNKEASVGEIARVINLSIKATSKHLNILSSLDILERNQIGPQMFYYLASGQKQITKHLLSLL